AIVARLAQQLAETVGLERFVEAGLVDELLLEIGGDDRNQALEPVVAGGKYTVGAKRPAAAQVDQRAVGCAIAMRSAAEAVEIHRDGDGVRAWPIDLVVLLVGPALLAVDSGIGLGRGVVCRLPGRRGEAAVDGGEIGARAFEPRIGDVVGPGDLAELAVLD